jgi:hypothetical protein
VPVSRWVRQTIAVLTAFSLQGVPCALAAPQRPARAPAPDEVNPSALSSLELRELRAGAVVTRPLRFEYDQRRYVGGVSYQLVKASPRDVLAALVDVDRLAAILPRTRRVRLVASAADAAQFELIQGNSLVQAQYGILLVRHSRDELRFWLDRGRPHDIEDVWGYFRAQRFDSDRTLMTVGVALDLGPGIVRLLFEDHIQRLILATPQRIRDVVEPRAVALAD